MARAGDAEALDCSVLAALLTNDPGA